MINPPKGASLFVIGVCLLASAAPQHKARLTTADKWAIEISNIVGDPRLTDTTEQQMLARVKRIIPSITAEAFEGKSPENGIDDLAFNYSSPGPGAPPRLTSFKISIRRIDPEGHELFPRLARRLNARLLGPRWKLRGKIAQGSAYWYNPKDRLKFSLTLTDNESTLILQLDEAQDEYHSEQG